METRTQDDDEDDFETVTDSNEDTCTMDSEEDNISDETPSPRKPKTKRKKIDETTKKKKESTKISQSKSSKSASKENDKKKQKSETDKKVQKKSKTIQKKSRDVSDEEDDDDEDYDTEDAEEDEKKGPGIILSIDAFGGGGAGVMGWNTDEVDYKEMMREDKNEVCDSDDERMFMKEQYVGTSTVQDTNLSSTSSKKNMKNTAKDTKTTKKQEKQEKKKKQNSEEETEDANETTQTDFKDAAKEVEKQYAELSQLKRDLTEQLNKNPNSKILQKAIEECRTSISELVRKERKKNANRYYKLVTTDEDKRNTNELSYFKKKLSHKEQLKVMDDLTEINAFTNTDKPYRLALLESNIPPKFKAVALQKLNVLKSMEPSDSEYYKMKNWVDGFMRVPHGVYKHLEVKLSDGLDTCHTFIEDAKSKLDACVYGLNDAKLQILQMIGQWISNPSAVGTAIAIKGPMGTGKTTLVKDGISKILGREFAFIALGGTGDASFLEGHSYTYEGSTWGKIISILMESKCMNPVIYFDELDKISDTPRGEEIVSILTHLTDTTQNMQYHDKYFSEVDFDLSKCLFIFSYNEEDKVNPILRDRMYRIQTKGYDSKEKVTIARRHLLPKIREQVNFTESDVTIPDDTLQYLISNEQFSKGEQGVRNLKRCLEIVHTKLNLFRLVKEDTNMFEKDMKIGKVTFPFTVEKKHIDILVKSDETLNQSMMAMYV